MNQMIGDRPILFEPNSQRSDDFSLLQMFALIADTFGIHIQPQYQDTLKKNFLTRIRALGLSSLNDYYHLLVATNQLIPSATEWQELISLLTVTETYFFRDQGQMSLLKNQLLPELIERKRQLSLTHCNATNGEFYRPTLRLWSAGCSTGEEAYSLAILVKELIFDYQAWDILILGTDINQPAIALAEQGIYSDWSFRTITPEIKSRYFRSHKKGWEIDPAIRAMVTFQPENLMQDSYPAYTSSIHDLDLILCRNVFIYFDFNAIARVLDKFYCSLAPGGFLLTGHTELHGQKTEPFQVKNFLQSAVYQRHRPHLLQQGSGQRLTPAPKLERGETGISNPALPTLEKKLGFDLSVQPKGVSINTQQTLLDAAKRSLTQEAYADVIQIAEQLIALAPQHFQAYCLMAEAYANFGDYSQGNQACQQALQINPLAIEPYHLLAQIAEEQGDQISAKLFLKRIIYLAPTSVTAHLELGSIYEREGNVKQAQKIWRSLLEILQNLPQEQAIDSNNQQTTAELKAYVLKHLN
ncbi:MAG: CheR family methyltransferase [Nostoc sp.]|uniref:CheR family methyltransferase n=1 Tax=Nostoc sp. TaxID=1180 RepID=UPI002FF4D123